MALAEASISCCGIFGQLKFAFDRLEHAGDGPDVPHAALLRGEAVALHRGGDAVADFDVDDAGLGAFDREIEVVTFRALLPPKVFRRPRDSRR